MPTATRPKTQPETPLRALRRGAGLTQAELAAAAKVSRALVSAVEAGRHLPRVDAALALARVLGVSAEELFAPAAIAAVDALSGEPAAAGAPLRLAFVGEQPVTTAARHDESGWQSVDWVGDASGTPLAGRSEPGLVVAGCEPSLTLLERLLRDSGVRAMAVASTTVAALRALAAGRLHAAAVHYPAGEPPARGDTPVARFGLARWRVGLAAPAGAPSEWWRDALAGATAVIQREPTAAAQQAFERARSGERRQLEGPRVGGHLAASRRAVVSGLPAVTIEPAARAVGADFHPLETHEVELWVRAEHAREPSIARCLDLLAGADFRRTLASVGGYDLAPVGTALA